MTPERRRRRQDTTTGRRQDGTAGRRPDATAVRVYELVPVRGLSLESVARRSGMHPEMVRRLVTLGLVDATRDPAGRLRFDRSAPRTLARIQRLRAGLPLNYASIGLVLDLLDRIGRLEAALRRTGARSDDVPWT
ncbi:chaperone modulator CbpM [Streptomyces sp. NPDC088147]|uniref:chaperone modulator CbpM n=1 Tax=Streptomyces sp. NPDC088147 TaxID=3365830 RepID=UPI0037FAFEBA